VVFAHRRLPRRMQMLFTGVSRLDKEKEKTLCPLCLCGKSNWGLKAPKGIPGVVKNSGMLTSACFLEPIDHVMFLL